MDNKYNLIEVALNLFDDKGYQGVGIQEICEKAGVTKPTLYHYFGSKLGLLTAIFETKLKEDIKIFEEAARYNGDFRYSIQKLTFALANCYLKETRTYHLLFSYILNSRENEDYSVALKYLNRIHKIVLNLFISSKDQNGNMNGRELQFAYSYLAVLIDYLNRHGMDDNNESDIYSLVHQFQFGINS
jgi:TetR/AcrR family transcriptional regulator